MIETFNPWIEGITSSILKLAGQLMVKPNPVAGMAEVIFTGNSTTELMILFVLTGIIVSLC